MNAELVYERLRAGDTPRAAHTWQNWVAQAEEVPAEPDEALAAFAGALLDGALGPMHPHLAGAAVRAVALVIDAELKPAASLALDR